MSKEAGFATVYTVDQRAYEIPFDTSEETKRFYDWITGHNSDPVFRWYEMGSYPVEHIILRHNVCKVSIHHTSAKPVVFD